MKTNTINASTKQIDAFLWTVIAAVGLGILTLIGGEGIMALLLIVLYFLPSLIAIKKKNTNAITVANLFFGWTIIGWIICLIWACTKD